MSLRIIQLQAENIKRVRAVDISPEDDVIVLSGMNGEGKTSVLDAIWLALQYAAAKRGNPTPLRAGTSKGRVTVDLGDYIVTRKFTENGSTLEVRDPSGNPQRSPQKILDGLIGDLSFDPWEFARKTEKEQRQMLADVLYSITEGEVDLAAFDANHKEAFEKRSDCNREKKRLATLLTQMAPPLATDPEELLSVSDLTTAITDAVSVTTQAQRLASEYQSNMTCRTRLEAELRAARDDEIRIAKEIANLPDAPDVEFLKGELANIEERNKRAREVMAYRATKDGLTSVDEEIKGYNDTMELLEINKAEALEDSPLPVKGLRVTPESQL